MDRLCLRSNRIQGFLRFDLLRFTLARPWDSNSLWIALWGICFPCLKSMILSSRLAPKFCSLWTSSISLVDSSSKGFFFLPNFLMIRGILVFVQCIQTRFTVDGLNFISCAILLVLSHLFLARMIYLIFLSVSFTTLFFFPMPHWWVYKVKGFGTTHKRISDPYLFESSFHSNCFLDPFV